MNNTAAVDPTNVRNDFDYIGDEHNLALIQYVDSLTSTQMNFDADYAYDRFYSEELPEREDFLMMVKQFRDESHSDYTGLADSLYRANVQLFIHFFNLIEIVEADQNLDFKVEAVNAYEDNLDYSSLPPEEELALEAMFSVARHSMVLWETTAQDGLGYGDTVTSKRYIGGSKDTHDIVLADIGGVFGAALFTGNPFCALAGGVVASAWEWGTQTLG